MAFFTREFFDLLIIIVIILGSALAIVRLYQDFTRPLPPYAPRQHQHDDVDDNDSNVMP